MPRPKRPPKSTLNLAILKPKQQYYWWRAALWLNLCFLPLQGLTQAANQLDSLDQLLYQAVQQGNAKQVKKLVKQGASVQKNSPVPFSDLFDDLSIILRATGETIAQVPGKSVAKTPSESLVQDPDEPIAQNPGEPIVQVPYKPIALALEVSIAPIHLNAIFPDVEVLEVLLKAGALVDARDEKGRTPLMYALRRPEGDQWALQLLQKGANYTIRDDQGFSTLHYAASGGNLESIRLTASGGVDLNTTSSTGITPLHLAAASGHKTSLQALLDLGAQLSQRDERGWNALHFAAPQASKETVGYLYEHSPELFRETSSGANPLDLAYAAGNDEVAIYFRRQGHDFGDFHFPDLIAALQEQDAEQVRLHLKAGANPNRKAETYPLSIAAQNGDLASIRYLLRYGARLDQVDDTNRNPLALAFENGHPDCVAYLLNEGAQPQNRWLPSLIWQSREAAVRAEWMPIITSLINKVTDLNTPGGELELSALQYAAYLSEAELTQQLLKQGANPQQQDAEGWTALHWAVIKRAVIAQDPAKVQIAQYLIEAGAAVSQQTHTPKELPHRQAYLARRVPGNATPKDLLDYALPKDSAMLHLLDSFQAKQTILATDYYENGTVLMELKLYEPALVEFNKCLKREPEFAAAYYERGRCKQVLGMTQGAVIDFDQAIRFRPFYPEAYFQRGKSQGDLEQYPQAEADLSKALSQGLRKGEVHYLLGLNKVKQNRYMEACQDFEQAMAKGYKDAFAAHGVYCAPE